MDILRIVVKKRTEDKKSEDKESLGRFASRIAKLRGEGPMATSDEPEVALEVVSINIRDIEVLPNYPRKVVGDVKPLIASIRVFGIQQPLKVVKLKGTKKYRLVFGRRRLKAAEKAGMDAVPCIVELVTREDRLQMLSMVENLHRSKLNTIEKAIVYQKMLEQKGAKIEEIAKSLGIAKDSIHEIVELFSLPSAVRKEIIGQSQKFTFSMLKILLNTYKKSKMNGKKLTSAILANQVTTAAQAKAFVAKLYQI